MSKPFPNDSTRVPANLKQRFRNEIARQTPTDYLVGVGAGKRKESRFNSMSAKDAREALKIQLKSASKRQISEASKSFHPHVREAAAGEQARRSAGGKRGNPNHGPDGRFS